jgi:hypothetical protein
LFRAVEGTTILGQKRREVTRSGTVRSRRTLLGMSVGGWRDSALFVPELTAVASIKLNRRYRLRRCAMRSIRFENAAATEALSVLGLSVTGRVVVCLATVSLAFIVAGLLSYAISEDPIARDQQLIQPTTTIGIIRKTDTDR